MASAGESSAQRPVPGAASLRVPAIVVEDEARRVAAVERAVRSTVAIFEPRGGNGGSGVIVSDDGLVVTNYHVVSPCGPVMPIGLADGRVVEGVVVGLDPTGDIALVQLLGKGPYPPAVWGDSDRVAVGDEAIVVGNPFLLATDFRPTVTVGIVSGVDRYQPPAGGVLEYAGCLQTDAAINPGNSGGPLFDGAGRWIGVNGRGSFEKRGRVNVGVGYAVSVNQVKRFLTHLAAGRLVDHGSVGLTVFTREGVGAVVDAIDRESDAYRRGVRPGDEIVAIGGRDTPTANAVLNAIGVLPSGWRVRLSTRRGDAAQDCEVRLDDLQPPGVLVREVERAERNAAEPPQPPSREVYERREGFGNYAVARRAAKRLVKRCRVGEGTNEPAVAEYFDAVGDRRVRLELCPESAAWIASDAEYRLDAAADLAAVAAPLDAPPLLAAWWVWGRLASGDSDRLDETLAWGDLPWTAGATPGPVLRVRHRGVTLDVYFEPAGDDADVGADGGRRPIGWEASRTVGEDRVRVTLDWAGESGSRTPSGWHAARWRAMRGDRLVVDARPAEAKPTGDGGQP